jgi:hypothetical protein
MTDPLQDPRFVNYEELKRSSSAGMSMAKLRRFQLEAEACKQFCMGADKRPLYNAAWKFATESRRKSYMSFEDFHQVTECPFVFKLHAGRRDFTGIVRDVGFYLDRLPDKLIRAYLEWRSFASDSGYSGVPMLVFRMPQLTTKMAVIREGDGHDMGVTGVGRILYFTEKHSFVIQSMRSLGQESEELW